MGRLLLIGSILVAASLAEARQPTAEIRAHVALLSEIYGIERELILAIIKVESNFEVKAVGKSHKERGLMQLNPRYFPTARFDVASNLRQGVRYLARVREACYERYREAWFICYNTGPNARLKKPKTFSYYKKVMYAKEKGIYKEDVRSLARTDG